MTMNMEWNHVLDFLINSRNANTINGNMDRLNTSLETFSQMCYIVTVIFKKTAAWTSGLEEQKHPKKNE